MESIHVDLTPEECENLTNFWQTIQKNPQLQNMASGSGGTDNLDIQQVQSAFNKIATSYRSYSG